MGLNRQLIATIKGHFAGKTTAQLQEIVRLKDLDRWSEGALIAADEVLAERAAGRSKEPRVPVEDAPILSVEERFGELLPILGFAVGGLVGGWIGQIVGGTEDQPFDRPVSFGSHVAWLAVDSTDTVKVAAALGLQRLRE